MEGKPRKMNTFYEDFKISLKQVLRIVFYPLIVLWVIFLILVLMVGMLLTHKYWKELEGRTEWD